MKIEIEKERIWFLRQWLNEDCITDPKRMVTNEDLEHWLIPAHNREETYEQKRQRIALEAAEEKTTAPHETPTKTCTCPNCDYARCDRWDHI